MGRAPCCDKVGLKRGRWTAEEDEILINYIKQNGEGSWRSLPKNAGLLRCGKSCRLRWINYLREDLKRGNFTREEEETIIKLHRSGGNRWSLIASNLPGRTDNEIKNYWNSHLSRKIYSFRSCSGSLVSNIDTVKMAKRKGGRVSRAFAKKYNINAISKVTTETLSSTSSSGSKPKCGSTSGIQEATAAGNAEVGSAEERGRNYSMTVNERQNINGIDGFNCNYLQGCPWTSVESAEKMEREHEVLGPNGELDDVTLLLDQFFQGGLMDLNEISVHSEETGKKPMVESTSVNNEGDNCANSHSDIGDPCECFSPLNSCFNHDDSFIWNNEYAFHEFQLWDERDDLLWP